MRKTNHASMQVPPLSLHAPAVDCLRNDDRMMTARPTAVPLCTYISQPSDYYIYAARERSLYTGLRLTSVSCQFISLVNCFCVELVRLQIAAYVMEAYSPTRISVCE